jgi:hypothetical protein
MSKNTIFENLELIEREFTMFREWIEECPTDGVETDAVIASFFDTMRDKLLKLG